MKVSIKNTTRKAVPRIKFGKIKDSVLAPSYELSLVFVSQAASRKLNSTHRGKDKPTNILSFPLSKDSGEIFLDLATAKLEHEKFDMTFRKFVVYLFIHGLLHLKGMEHGRKMELAEKKLNGTANHFGY